MSKGFSFSALRERRAVRYLLGYLVAAWATTQIVGFFVEQGYVGRTVLDITLFVAAVGFLAAVVLVWYHGEEGPQTIRLGEVVLLALLGVAALVGSRMVAGGGGADRPRVGPGDVFVDLGDRSIAVLPFRNDLSDPSMQWLDRGVSELLATDLAQVPSLRVVGGQRVIDLLRQLGEDEGRTVPERLRSEVTRLAGARYLLTGSIFGSLGSMVLTASMQDADTGEITAATRQQGTDVFALVDAVSADLLEKSLAPGSRSSLAPVSELTTRNLDSYAAYQKGVEAQGRFLWTEARAHLTTAVELDSSFARAALNLAGVQIELGEFGAAMESLTRARRHVHSASEQERLFIEGLTTSIGGDFEAASVKFDQLISRYPAEKEARIIYSGIKNALGRHDEAKGLLEDAIRLDPSYAQAYNALAYHMARAGDFDSALVLVDRLVALEPGQPNPLDTRGEMYERAGRFEEARVAYREALEAGTDFTPAIQHLARTYMREEKGAAGRAELLTRADAMDDRSKVHALRSVGDLWLWDGKFTAGLDQYREAASLASEAGLDGAQAVILRALGFSAVMLGRLDLAESVGHELVRLDSAEAMTRDLIRIVAEGERGTPRRIDDIAAAFLRDHGAKPDFEPFLAMVANSFGGVAAFYRGHYAAVLDSAAVAPLGSAAGFEYPGLPVLRALVEMGEGQRALAQIDVARRAGIMGTTGQFEPVVERLLVYFRGRGLELEADTVGALEAYGELWGVWGNATREVPWVSDLEGRASALGGALPPR